jgi:hypothetical protein
MADESRASASELNTSLLPVADFSKQTGTEDETSVKTRVNKGESNPNKSTTIQPLAEMTQTGGKRKSRFAAGAVALIGLLVAGALASALYVFKPEIFRQAETPNVDRQLNLADAPKNESNASVTNADSIVADTTTNTNASTINAPVETATTKKENPPKTDEKMTAEIPPIPKNNPRDAKPQPNQSGATVGENTDEDADDDEVKMTGDRIETKDVIIDEKGDIKFKNPQVRPGGARVYNVRPRFTPEQMRRMTPEQREKLRKAMELYRMPMPKFEPPTPPAPQAKPTQN